MCTNALQSSANQRGLTLIELLVTLAIAGVLIGVAAPSFNEFAAQRSLTTQVNHFILAAALARSEAIKRGTQVSVQAIDSSDSDNEWGSGWCVVVGNPGDCAAPLRRFDDLDGNSLNGEGALDSVDSVVYNSRGLMVGGLADSMQLCAEGVATGRRLNISVIGRVDSEDAGC